ncbi:uncharacterized protein V1510DRAFT_418732 [Dipodascopsis tothii]|uniref:uncharacterized protein n=1 Tax=Dipodascopsis tothii TaxID=44089 RepID=UPI0034CF3E27
MKPALVDATGRPAVNGDGLSAGASRIEELDAEPAVPPASPRKSAIQRRRGASKSVSFAVEDKPAEPEAPPGLFAESMLLLLDYTMVLVPLASFHVVLDVLVYRQYGQEIVLNELLHRGAISFLVLGLIHAVLHPGHAGVGMQMLILLTAMMIGMYLVHVCQTQDYFAVMKQAPPLATLLGWAAIELEPYWSTLAMACVGFWYWCVRV